MDSNRIREGGDNLAALVETKLRADPEPDTSLLSVDEQVAIARFGIQVLFNFFANVNDMANFQDRSGV